MEQSLFAIIYEDEDTTRKALQVFRKLHQLGHVNLQRGELIVRQAGGQVATHAPRDFKIVNPKYGLAGLAGTVAGLVGAAPLGPGALVMGAFMGAVTTTGAMGWDFSQNKGLPPALVQKISAAIPVGSSAVLVQVAIVNSEIVAQAVSRLGSGVLLPLSLNEKLSSQLNAALAGEQNVAGEQPSAPVVRPKAAVVTQKVPIDKPQAVPVKLNKSESGEQTASEDAAKRVAVSFKPKA